MDGRASHSTSPFAGSLVIPDDDLEAGLSSAAAPFPSYYTNRRRGSYRALSLSGGAARGFFCDALSDGEPRHFLDSCSLCRKPLSCNRDIFMYRGDTPFCSEECRQEQIDIDEAMEKRNKLSTSWKKRLSSCIKKEGQYAKPHDTHISAAGTVRAG